MRSRPITTLRGALVCCAAIAAIAAIAANANGAEAPAPRHELTADDLHAWLDGLLPHALESGDIAGMTIAVVKDGEVLVQAGYGHADVASRRPMDPEQTLIRAGSTSKLFTWTAVMQLVEAGKLDLDRDVNDYLDFRIPAGGGRPVTLLDLMNHRGGFEEGLKDVLAVDPARLQSTKTYLETHPRPRLFAAGRVPAYSNYGTALAGYVVERVAGEPFERYVEKHIFAPLGMRSSTFGQPLPPAFAAAVSRGYRTASEPALPVELIATAPAGSLTTSVVDLTRFMRAHLQRGEFEGARILGGETIARMQASSHDVLPGFASMAHGFMRSTVNGRTVLGHGGDTIAFHTEFALLPEEGVGITYSFNSRGRDDAVYALRQAVFDGFMDRYFPAATAAPARALDSARADAARIAGRYRSSRRVEHGFIGVFYLLQQLTIAANADGTITAPGEFGAGTATFREIAPDLWEQVDGPRRLALQDVDGVKTVVDSADPTSVLQAVPASRNSGLSVPVLLLAVPAVLLVALAWPVSALLRRRYGAPAEDAAVRVPKRRVRAIALYNVVWLAAWCVVLAPIARVDLAFYSSALDPAIRVLQVAGVLLVVANAVALWNLWRLGIARGRWTTWVRHVAVGAAFVGIVWIGVAGRLIDFGVNY